MYPEYVLPRGEDMQEVLAPPLRKIRAHGRLSNDDTHMAPRKKRPIRVGRCKINQLQCRNKGREV